MALFVSSVLCLVSMANWAFIKNCDYFILDKNVNILILGDSHTKYALNDSIIKNSYNFSDDADSYFYSFLKLKEIKKKNKQIDTLLLSFSQHNIDENIETSWLLNSSQLFSRLRFYYPLLDKEDFIFLLNKRPEDVLSNLFTQIMNPVYYIKKGKSKFGGYGKLDHDNLKQEIFKANMAQKSTKSEFKEASIEKKYLGDIRKFCRENGIKLIFINPPLHKTINANENNLLIFYKKYFSDVEFLDYSKLKIPNDYFGDLVHLSPKGSVFFSKLIEKKESWNLFINKRGLRTKNTANMR